MLHNSHKTMERWSNLAEAKKGHFVSYDHREEVGGMDGWVRVLYHIFICSIRVLFGWTNGCFQYIEYMTNCSGFILALGYKLKLCINHKYHKTREFREKITWKKTLSSFRIVLRFGRCGWKSFENELFCVDSVHFMYCLGIN